MTTSSKVSISVFTLAIVALGVYGFSIFKDRVSSPSVDKKIETSQQESPTDTSNSQSTADNSATDTTDDSVIDANENAPVESNNYLDVSKADCENSCKDFTDPDDLKYCQEICGIIPVKKDITEKKGCEALKDLEKDYCFKDLAITSNDLSICQSIDDSNVKKACRNRIAENLSASQQ